MPRNPLAVRTGENARAMHVAAALSLVLSVTFWLVGHASRPTLVSFVPYASVGLGLGGAFLLYSGYERRRHCMIDDEASVAGFTPHTGSFTDGLVKWPVGAFPALSEPGWVMTAAYQHADAATRIFVSQCYQLNDLPMLHRCGAAIRVDGAGFPVFSITPVERAPRQSTTTSTIVFPFDASFATQYSIVTTQPQVLSEKLGATFVSAYRRLGDWNIKGQGDWVVMWHDESRAPSQMTWLAADVRSMSDALQNDVGTR
jgi:hypothetical protein